jgi:hypothetical protein
LSRWRLFPLVKLCAMPAPPADEEPAGARPSAPEVDDRLRQPGVTTSDLPVDHAVDLQ